jgi:hypothetical protein
MVIDNDILVTFNSGNMGISCVDTLLSSFVVLKCEAPGLFYVPCKYKNCAC